MCGRDCFLKTCKIIQEFHMKAGAYFRQTGKLPLIGFLMAIAYWVVEGLIHEFFFEQRSFADGLLPSDWNELWMRLLISMSFFGFSLYASVIVARRKYVEEQLRDSRELYRTLAESAEDSIFILNRDLTVKYANRSAARQLGKVADEISGRQLCEFFDPDVYGAQRRHVERVFETGSTVNTEEKFAFAGQQLWLNTTLVPIEDETHGVGAVMGISRDITARKKAEELLREERDRARKYLDAAGVIFLILDAGRNVTLINRKGCEVLGYEELEIVGRDWFENFLPERIKAGTMDVFESLFSGDGQPAEYHENAVVAKGGVERLIAWHNVALRDTDGKVTVVLSSGEDITEKRLAEETLRERFEELERFRKATVKRELRIQELKDKVLELEKRMAQ